MVDKPLRIDTHQHFWEYHPQKHSWITNKGIQRDFNPEQLEPHLKRNNMDGCISVQVEASEAETLKLLELAEKYDFIKGVVGWIDPCGKELDARLEYFSRYPALKGIRHTVYDKQGEFLLEPDFVKGIQKLHQNSLHFELLVFPYQLKSAVALAKRLPEQRFVLNHLGKPDIDGAPSSEWVEQIRALGACDNVGAKLSGIVTQIRFETWNQQELQPYLEVMVESFGTNRLMFGSDWPVCTSVATYEETLGIVENFLRPFSDTEKEAVMGGNALSVYGL